jgi:hypothetical protein
MSCLTTNSAKSEYLPIIKDEKLIKDEPSNELNSELEIDKNSENKMGINKINQSESPTIESITCEINDFNRPTTPPASTPSPTQVKNVNKRKIRNQFFAGNNHISNSDDLDELELEENLDDEEIIEEEESLLNSIEQQQFDLEQNIENLNMQKEQNNDETFLSETDNEAELHIDENNNQLNNDQMRDLNEVARLNNKEITKEIIELNNRFDTELSNDLIVCGKCHTKFKLSDIVLFIEHKANKCSAIKNESDSFSIVNSRSSSITGSNERINNHFV